MQKKMVRFISLATILTASSIQTAQASDNLSLGINYGAVSGPTFELSYPLNDSVQIRGALSGGMKVSQDSSDTDIDYKVKSNGGVHRLALDYHPFNSSFFLSAGYAINNFELTAKGNETGTVTVGNDTFNATVDLKGTVSWKNAPTLSLGWGHSPDKGLGFLIEAGAFMTGKPDLDIKGTCTGACVGFDDALSDEEKKLEDDIADFNFLPMLQAGVTYRF